MISGQSTEKIRRFPCLERVVSVISLALGIACCLWSLGYANYCRKYDSTAVDADDVFVVEQRSSLTLNTPWYDQAPLFILNEARRDPNVAAATGYLTWFPLVASLNGELHELRSLTVLPGFVELMGLHAVRGDMQAALTAPNCIALTEREALRLFGTSDVIGRAVSVTGAHEEKAVVRIEAILRDPPLNTTIPFDALNGLNLSLMPPGMVHEASTGEMGWNGHLLLRLKPDASAEAITSVLQKAVDQAPSVQSLPEDIRSPLMGRRVMEVKLSGLTRAFFQNDIAVNEFTTHSARGDWRAIAGIAAFGLLVLVLAADNFVELEAARFRAGRQYLGRRLPACIAALSISAGMAALVGVALATGAYPAIAAMVSPDQDLQSLVSLDSLVAAFVGSALIGAFCAALAAASGMRRAGPGPHSPPGSPVRSLLGVLQISTAFGCLSIFVAVALQVRFALNATPGFDPSPQIVFNLPPAIHIGDGEKSRRLIAEFMEEPAIASVSVERDAIGGGRAPWGNQIQRMQGPVINAEVRSVDSRFFEQFGIQAVAGRVFAGAVDKDNDPLPIVIDAAAARGLGFSSPFLGIGETVRFQDIDDGVRTWVTKRIVGIAPPIRFGSLHNQDVPTAYILSMAGSTAIVAKSRSSLESARLAIRRVWSRYFPGTRLEMHTASELYERGYAGDARLVLVLAAYAAITWIIAVLGVYRWSRHPRAHGKAVAERDAGRDVGAFSTSQEFILVVLAAALVTLPPVELGIVAYQSSFAQKTMVAPLVPWMMLLVAVSIFAHATRKRQGGALATLRHLVQAAK